MSETARSEKQFRAEIEAARAEYQAAVETQPAHICAPLSTKVRTLQAELAAFLAAGAQPCPLTKSQPIGLKKRPGVYEVGPIDSPLRARGETAADAVEAWNGGRYVPPKFALGDLRYEPVGLEAFAQADPAGTG